MATYYIDYANGNDATGNGSTDTPWKTLSKFLSSCSNGDTCKVRGNSTPGTYQRIATALSTSKTSLTIEADVENHPWLVGTVEYTSWSKTDGKTNVYETAYTTSCYGVYCLEVQLSSKGSVDLCDATSNSYYFDDANNKLYVNIGGDIPTSIEAAPNWNYLLTTTGSGMILSGLYFCLNGANLLYINADDCSVFGCKFGLVGRGAGFGSLVDVAKNRAMFDRCYFNGTQYTCVYLKTGSNYTNFANCRFTKGVNGLQVDSGTGHVIEHSQIDACSGDGIKCNTGDITVHDCTLFDCGHSHIMADSSDATITGYRNTIFLTQDTKALFGTGNSHGHVIENGASCYFYNTTVVHLNRSSATGGGFKYGWYTLASSSSYIRNCISYDNASDYSVAVDSTCDEDYNFNGLGSHSVPGGDPGFVNTDDFRLLPTSPCIDAGTLVTGINEGFRGGAPDIGAHEYVRPLRHGRR